MYKQPWSASWPTHIIASQMAHLAAWGWPYSFAMHRCLMMLEISHRRVSLSGQLGRQPMGRHHTSTPHYSAVPRGSLEIRAWHTHISFLVAIVSPISHRHLGVRWI